MYICTDTYRIQKVTSVVIYIKHCVAVERLVWQEKQKRAMMGMCRWDGEGVWACMSVLVLGGVVATQRHR